VSKVGTNHSKRQRKNFSSGKKTISKISNPTNQNVSVNKFVYFIFY
jgi:hypothetical protein